MKSGAISIYHCGPTVYDTPHLGNYRTFVMDDLIRRMFEYNGYKVHQVMNITDVDDKTIRRSREQNVSLKDLTTKYELLFLDGLNMLNIERPHDLVRASENIQSMIDLINALLSKGFAYRADDGVYMSIEKVASYGALAHIKTEPGSQKERIANDEYNKENPGDFALWKFEKSADGDVHYDAPFGVGRPGWHIECSAMSMKVLGETFDLHTGGIDLIFPHHTNEIAQSESATGKPFVRYWMHGGFMTMDQEKMAKSKGNIIKLEDLETEVISPLAFRYWLFSAHYRSPINFSFEALEAAQNALIRLTKTVGSYPDGGSVIDLYSSKFNKAVNDDLDMPKALALVWELLKDSIVSAADKRGTIIHFDQVLGLKLKDAPRGDDVDVPAEVNALVEAREEARKSKEWGKADALRQEIERRGFMLNDTPDGVRVVRK